MARAAGAPGAAGPLWPAPRPQGWGALCGGLRPTWQVPEGRSQPQFLEPGVSQQRKQAE